MARCGCACATTASGQGGVTIETGLGEVIRAARAEPVEGDPNVFVVANDITFNTDNDVNYNTVEKVIFCTKAWNGPIRLYLSPTNLGVDGINKIPFDAYTVEWIKITVKNVGFPKTHKTVLTYKDTLLSSAEIQNPQDLFDIRNTNTMLTGTSERGDASVDVGYFDKDDLETLSASMKTIRGRNPDTPVQTPASVLTKAALAENASIVTGVGLLPLRAADNYLSVNASRFPISTFAHYLGPYASAAATSQTVPLSSAFTILIKSPQAGTFTRTFDGSSVSLAYSTMAPIPRKQSLIQYMANTVGQGDVSIPVYGALQLDLPASIAQTIAARYGTPTVVSNETTPATHTLVLPIELMATNCMLDIHVEYAFRNAVSN